jgi:hypothetical protein
MVREPLRIDLLDDCGLRWLEEPGVAKKDDHSSNYYDEKDGLPASGLFLWVCVHGGRHEVTLNDSAR